MLLKMIVAALPIVLLCVMSRRVNLKKPERSKQVLMPVIAAVYVVAAMLLMNKINEWLLDLIGHIPESIRTLGAYSWMPSAWSDALFRLSDRVRSLLNGLTLDFWIFFISNAVILLVYLLLKRVCIAVMRKAVKPDGGVFAGVVSEFYEYDEDHDRWCIKEGYSQTRGFLHVMYGAAVCLSICLMFWSKAIYERLAELEGGASRVIFYPVFGIILIAEMYFFLDGLTKQEYMQQILGEDDVSMKTVNYTLIRKYLRSLFGDKLAAENTGLNNSLAYGVTNEEVLQELLDSEDRRLSSFAVYFEKLEESGFEIDHNYFFSSLDLLNGKSILFNDPFYSDLIPYAFYPMNRVLLEHQKVLVILGRHAIEDDIRQWLQDGIGAVTNIPFMWRISVLNDQPVDTDIGILTRSQVLNIRVHDANADFLNDVGFVVIVEPSKLISTAQIGLNMIVKKCLHYRERNIVYCLCDKNCDGLVDAMSHILLTSITEVAATGKYEGTSSYMCWDPDDDHLQHRLLPNISRYLGVGTELSFAALKNQVSVAKWYGGDAFPVSDIRWIDKQYYYDLMRYADLPASQEEMDEHFITSPNFWSAKKEKYNYITVEDESFNMFEVLRDFSTRATEQGFVNVISSDYLLRDYMADNASIFETDPKAIPCIVADFVRSERNAILKLILMMTVRPTGEALLVKELSLLGVKTYDLRAQIWYEIYKCYSDVSSIKELPEDYREAVAFCASKPLRVDGDAMYEIYSDILISSERFNVTLGEVETVWSIRDKSFIANFAAELRSAAYVTEDEKGDKYYFGAELNGHIYQKYLPGQFFTFDGKYYEMTSVTADGNMLVRRAADHIVGRKFYRQIRRYTVGDVIPDTRIGACKDVSGMKIVRAFSDITVTTLGYYLMNSYDDLRTAKKVLFDAETGDVPVRSFHNKNILRIDLPDADGKLTDNVRYTLAVMMNEVFRTIFAENQPFIVALTDDSFITDPAACRPLTYSIEASVGEIGRQSIYVIEDSQLDLGLLDAAERNMSRILEIVCDQIDWHYDALEASLVPPVEPEPVPYVSLVDVAPEDEDAGRKKGLLGKIRSFFGGRSGKKDGKKDKKAKKEDKKKKKAKKKKKDKTKDPVDPVPDPGLDDLPDPTVGDLPDPGIEDLPAAEDNDLPDPGIDDLPAAEDNDLPDPETDDLPLPEEKADPEFEADDLFGQPPEAPSAPAEPVDDAGSSDVGEDVGPSDGLPGMPDDREIGNVTDDEIMEERALKIERIPYHERYFMLYGHAGEPENIDLRGTGAYLSQLGCDMNSLRQARKGVVLSEYLSAATAKDDKNLRRCDFCGVEILGVEFETLADGRDRCMNCSRTAIRTGEEFKRIFEDVKHNMESFYGIKLNAPVRVEMVNARTLHKKLNKSFVPSKNTDPRVLGVAINSRRDGFSLLVENGSPRMMTMLTIAHELTHIWQYLNWNEKALKRKYGKQMLLEIYEGMAKWAEVQYAFMINEPTVAKRAEIETMLRDDEYGRGFIRYRANYPLSRGVILTGPTPFMNIAEPLEPDFCGPIGEMYILPPELPQPIEGGDKKRKPYDVRNKNDICNVALRGGKDRSPGSVPRYAYGLLSDAEKQLYDRVVDAMSGHEPKVADTAGFGIGKDRFAAIMSYISYDHPEIFWFANYKYSYSLETSVVNDIDLLYNMTKEEAAKRQEQIDLSIGAFLSCVTDEMSDFEVVLKIYENIIKLIDYDTIGLERQKRERAKSDEEDLRPDDLRSIYGVFVNKKAVCAGYARATQYLLNMLGIECAYYSNGEHAWNIVRLEGDYYHLDTTWGDSSNTKPDKNVSDDISYDCFCITTEELSRLKEHQFDPEYPAPECVADACNYYTRFKLVFDRYDPDRVRDTAMSLITHGMTTVALKCADDEVYQTMVRELIEGHKFVDILQYINLKSDVRVASAFSYFRSDEHRTLRFKVKVQQ